MRNSVVSILVLAAFVLLVGCTQAPSGPAATALPQSTATPVPTAIATPLPTATPSPTPEAFAPLKLDYQFTQSGPQGSPGRKMYFSLWLNEQKDCGTKKAYLGLMQASEDASMPAERSGWGKITVYADTGSMAASKLGGKSDLAFDNAKSANMDFDFFLTLNNLFNSAGKNFLADGVWTTDVPVLLKNVQFGSEFVNVSVMKGTDTTEFAVPCTKFSLLAQGQGPGEMSACVAKVSSKMPLPFTVSYAIGSDTDVKLVKVSSEKSSAVFFPQCLEEVKCAPVAAPSASDVQACQAKKGSLDPMPDDRNCVTSYACRTERERALADVRQPPNCPAPSDAVINTLIQCRTSGGNWNFQNDAQGCVVSVSCGGMQPPQQPPAP